MKDVYLDASGRSQCAEDGIGEGRTVLLDNAVGVKILKILFLEVEAGCAGGGNIISNPGGDHCAFEALLF